MGGIHPHSGELNYNAHLIKMTPYAVGQNNILSIAVGQSEHERK